MEERFIFLSAGESQQKTRRGTKRSSWPWTQTQVTALLKHTEKVLLPEGGNDRGWTRGGHHCLCSWLKGKHLHRQTEHNHYRAHCVCSGWTKKSRQQQWCDSKQRMHHEDLLQQINKVELFCLLKRTVRCHLINIEQSRPFSRHCTRHTWLKTMQCEAASILIHLVWKLKRSMSTRAFWLWISFHPCPY